MPVYPVVSFSPPLGVSLGGLEVEDWILGMAVVVLAGVSTWMFLNKRREESAPEQQGASAKKLENLLPLRISAAERLVLYLERIRPDQLTQSYSPGEFSSAHQLMRTLQQQVQAEFEHNVVQQLYISHEAWLAVCYAKDSTLKLLELTLEKLPEKASALDYRTRLLKAVREQPSDAPSPIDKAIYTLKKEFQDWIWDA